MVGWCFHVFNQKKTVAICCKLHPPGSTEATKEGLPEDPSTATEEPESEETEAWSYVPVA